MNESCPAHMFTHSYNYSLQGGCSFCLCLSLCTLHNYNYIHYNYTTTTTYTTTTYTTTTYTTTTYTTTTQLQLHTLHLFSLFTAKERDAVRKVSALILYTTLREAAAYSSDAFSCAEFLKLESHLYSSVRIYIDLFF